MRSQFLAVVMVGLWMISPRAQMHEKFITVSSTILGGTVEKQPGFIGGTATLCGTGSFSMTTGLGIFAVNFPGGQSDPILPGTTRLFGGTWIGGDLISPVFTFRGKTYDRGSPDLPGDFALSFLSEAVTIPPLSDGPTTLEAPFTFLGSVSRDTHDDVHIRVSLSGSGVGTLVLVPHPTVEGAWTSIGWQLEFLPSPNANGAPRCGGDATS
jgi:hypothetical protein